MTENCRSCEAPIQWALTAKGRRIPLDLGDVPPESHGAQVTWEDEHGRKQARSFTGRVSEIVESLNVDRGRAEEIVRSQYPAFLSHFATCPNAGQHRGRR